MQMSVTLETLVDLTKENEVWSYLLYKTIF